MNGSGSSPRLASCIVSLWVAGTLTLTATTGFAQDTAAAEGSAGREKLRAHSAEFRREVIEVTGGVWVAVGFSDANSVLIEGGGGSIVVDTTSDVEDASRYSIGPWTG
jgi:hypothetical protein